MKLETNSDFTKKKLDDFAINNFKELSIKAVLFPFFILILVFALLFFNGGASIENYIKFQEKTFLLINILLSDYKSLQFNLTQLGDALVFLPFLTVLIIYAPKFWEHLLTSLFFSAIISNILKKMLAVPRPAAIFNSDNFVILGEKLSGSTSLPSGHSIATFTILTLVYFAFAPQRKSLKRVWFLLVFISAIIVVSTRIGVGAHYPLDVVVGGGIGSAVSILSVFFNRKVNVWKWVKDWKYYPVFIFIFFVWAIVLINKIIMLNLLIFYFSLASLIISLLVLINVYVKKKY